MGITIDEDGHKVTTATGVTISERAHATLDILLETFKLGKRGGEVLLEVMGPDDVATGVQYRLTFCDFTGEKVCPFCNGTGAADS